MKPICAWHGGYADALPAGRQTTLSEHICLRVAPECPDRAAPHRSALDSVWRFPCIRIEELVSTYYVVQVPSACRLRGLGRHELHFL
jgi:hypothetical protein